MWTNLQNLLSHIHRASRPLHTRARGMLTFKVKSGPFVRSVIKTPTYLDRDIPHASALQIAISDDTHPNSVNALSARATLSSINSDATRYRLHARFHMQHAISIRSACIVLNDVPVNNTITQLTHVQSNETLDVIWIIHGKFPNQRPESY